MVMFTLQRCRMTFSVTCATVGTTDVALVAIILANLPYDTVRYRGNKIPNTQQWNKVRKEGSALVSLFASI